MKTKRWKQVKEEKGVDTIDATGYDKSAFDHRQHKTDRGQREPIQTIIERLIWIWNQTEDMND